MASGSLCYILATGIQGRLATQTPSKHPGHKPELLLLHAKGQMWAWSFLQPCACTLCVTFLTGMRAHLMVALPVSSEASSLEPCQFTHPPTPWSPLPWWITQKSFSTSSLSLCQCTQLKQGWNRRQQSCDGSIRPCHVVTLLTSSGLPFLASPKIITRFNFRGSPRTSYLLRLLLILLIHVFLKFHLGKGY